VERWATFDCYGTLIDWNGGLEQTLRRVFGSDGGELLARYHALEPQIQAKGPQLTYRDVMAEAMRGLGAPPDEEDALGSALPDWQPFPEARAALEEARSRGWRLAILSNTDRDFIDASIQRIGVEFDDAIVASEIGSYKPAHAHWHAFARAHERLPDVHVGASRFHDMAPAHELGIPSVWINRLGETAAGDANRELADLAGLGDTLDELAA
jgi:2-haloacid dehalogenase